MKRALLIATQLMPFIAVFAHSPNNAYFEIEKMNGKWYLTISITPVAAIDILRAEGLVSHNENVQLDRHKEVIARYFQNTTLFKFDNQITELKFCKAVLDSHDSELIFCIENMVEEFNSYEIIIRSLTDLYKRPLNMLDLNNSSGEIERHIFDHEITSVEKKRS